MYIKTYNLTKEWPPAVALKWCDANNFNTKLSDGRRPSLIRKTLKECIQKDTGTLIMAHDGRHYTGWGIAYKLNNCNANEFQCYVPLKHRRKGIATRILSKACKLHGKVEVYSIDTSIEFFKANGLTKMDAITGKLIKKLKP